MVKTCVCQGEKDSQQKKGSEGRIGKRRPLSQFANPYEKRGRESTVQNELGGWTGPRQIKLGKRSHRLKEGKEKIRVLNKERNPLDRS